MVSLTLLTMNAMALGKIESGATAHLAALKKLAELGWVPPVPAIV